MFLLGLLALFIGVQGEWVQQEPEVLPYDAHRSMWVLEKDAPADHLVTMTVALKVNTDRRAMLEKTFWEVSDPKHEKYGQHLTVDAITKLLSVPEARVTAVVTYFKKAGASSVDVAPNKDMITVEMS